MEIIQPYIKGLKYLFYVNNNGIETVSVSKVLFFVAYILVNVLAFLQFTTLPIQSITFCEDLVANNEDCEIPLGVYGNWFHVLTGLMLVTALLLIVKDSPVNQSNKHQWFIKIYLLISGVLIIALFFIPKTGNSHFQFASFVLIQFFAGAFVFTLIERDATLGKAHRLSIRFLFVFALGLIVGFSIEPIAMLEGLHNIGLGLVFLWFIIFEPVIFFGGLLFLIQIISEDYQLKGYGQKTRRFLISTVGIILLILVFFILYEGGSLLSRSDTILETGFFETRLVLASVEILFGTLFLLLIFVILTIFSFQLLDRRRGLSESREYFKAIIPWIVLYSLIFVFMRSIPALFIWGPRLKSITNIFDFSLLFFVLFFGLLRVITIPESNNSTISDRKKSFNPLTWLDSSPKYAKILLLFYLGSIIFFQYLEHDAIAVITGEIDDLKLVKSASLAGFLVVGFISVFLRYRPTPVNDAFPGPFKFAEIKINGLMQVIKKRLTRSSG